MSGNNASPNSFCSAPNSASTGRARVVRHWAALLEAAAAAGSESHSPTSHPSGMRPNTLRSRTGCHACRACGSTCAPHTRNSAIPCMIVRRHHLACREVAAATVAWEAAPARAVGPVERVDVDNPQSPGSLHSQILCTRWSRHACAHLVSVRLGAWTARGRRRVPRSSKKQTCTCVLIAPWRTAAPLK